MGKPDRMAVLALAGAVAAFPGQAPAGTVWLIALALILVGADHGGQPVPLGAP